MPVIIDGTNLLWALRDAFAEHEITTEVQLCSTLDHYFALTGEEGQIVFDGAGPPDRSAFDGVGHLEVVFSGFNCDTDAVIEEKIKASSAPKRLTVVSSDRRLRRAAGARKATPMKSEAFWEQLQRRLRRKRPERREPDEKQDGLTKGEAEQWMDFFGLED